MSIAKRQRRVKRQMGQFLTPEHLAKNIIAVIDFHPDDKVLEPSLGAGAFIFPLIERFMGFYTGTPREKVLQVLQRNLYGVELDEKLLTQCRQAINQRWGEVAAPNFVHGDFLQTNFTSAAGAPLQFDWVVGNPPFGGTLDARHEDALDKKYGMRAGAKIKKETYSFFIVKSLEALRPTGRLHLICSDTFLTINTMKGLRNYLRSSGKITVKGIQHFSGETAQKTVLLTCHKGPTAPGVTIDDNFIAQEDIQRTPNHSWGITPDLAKYFSAQTLGDFMIASSGMTVGKNELFIRKINAEMIAEPYDFNFHERPITLQGVTARARLGKITAAQEVQVREQEAAGETERVVVPQRKAAAQQIKIPHRDYCYYNKAQKGVVYAPPAYVIFWRQAGDAVYTYKKTGNWYLRGVGGTTLFFSRRANLEFNRNADVHSVAAGRLCAG